MAGTGSSIKSTQLNRNYLTKNFRLRLVCLYLVDQSHGGINVFKSSRDRFFPPTTSIYLINKYLWHFLRVRKLEWYCHAPLWFAMEICKVSVE